MANMNFGVNIIPKTNNTYTLGNSDYKWNIFANQINGTNVSSFLTSHQDISGKVSGPSSAIANNVALFDGTTGKLIKDSGFTIGKSVPSNAVFTDTTYSNLTAASAGTDVSLVTTGEKYIWNNKLNANQGSTNSGKILTINSSGAIEPTYSATHVYTGTGTTGQAGSSSKAYIPSVWTFDIGRTPVAGDIITITVPAAGISTGVWISVDNGVHYYPIAVNNKTRLTTQYAIDNQITLIYQEDMVTTTYGTDETGAPKGSSTADLTSDRWVVLNYYDANTTYTNVALGQGYGTCTTAAATAAKEVTLASYALTANGIVAVKFTYDVPANATLNINAKGAKAIYYKGAKITAGVIKAGDLAYFIYNSYYYLLGIDRVSELSSLSAASGGTAVSLVTTGEKYTWNNKSSLALGTSSTTAYRGDYGNSAYTHAVTNKGSAFSSGMYKITTNSEGHVTAATAIQKSDIIGLGITELPAVTSSDNGKILRVVNGAWALVDLPSANGVSF